MVVVGAAGLLEGHGVAVGVVLGVGQHGVIQLLDK
jgi:hypothetical protein